MAENRPVTDDVRARIGGRLPGLGFRSILPYAGSLVRDPLHASAYYIAIDAQPEAGPAIPMMLHLTLASAPANQVFPRSVLVGRMRPGGGREIVVNAIYMGIGDLANVRTFVEHVDPTLAARTQGLQSALCVEIADPARDLPVAFEAFRLIQKSTGTPMAVVSLDSADVEAAHFQWMAAWAALRSGQRGGYALETPLLTADSAAAAQTMAMAGFTSFRLQVSPDHLSAATAIWKSISGARRQADFGLAPGTTDPDALAACLQALKDQFVPFQFVEAPVESLAALAPIARSFGAVLSFRGDTLLDQESARAAGRATSRFRCRVKTPATARELVQLAEWLRS